MVRAAFVGCASSGQEGRAKTPADNGKAPLLPQRLADQLAYYQAAGIGVLAPKGWHCFGVGGSNGASILVTPERHSAQELYNGALRLKGLAVQASTTSSETSGRFHVAKVAARLFPDQKRFVEAIISEDIFPRSDFPIGPAPHDVITRRNDGDVEFTTPAGEQGSGTSSFLVPSDLPIDGVAILSKPDNDLLELFIRLPVEMRFTAPAIIEQARQ